MKSVTSQLAAFFPFRMGRRNIKALLTFLGILTVIFVTYSLLFHFFMQREGRGDEHSWFTGFYWTLTTMSTLGYGEIVFESDIGRMFSMVVLVTGMVTLLIVMPFTLIEFFYAPWVESQTKARAPRELPPTTKGHVLLTNHDPVTSALIRKFNQYDVPYALVLTDLELVLRLHDEGLNVVLGGADPVETFNRLQLPQCALVAATGTDVQNTHVAFSVREINKTIPVVTTASAEASVDVMELAGSSHVFRLGELMGQSLARRTTAGDAMAHVIGHFDKLLIAEATIAGTPLVGKTLAEAELRTLCGASVVGVWERGEFKIAGPKTLLTEKTVLVMAGSAEQLRKYDELFCIYHVSESPLVIIGGGRVGRAAGRMLGKRKLDFRIVEKLPERVQRFAEKAVIGDAAEFEILEKAGISEAPAVIITTHDDDVNIYLTIYCRKLRPDIQIITRATQDQNVSTMHRAGADFVMSYASMGANIIFNYLKRSDILMVAEGLNVFRVKVPPSLVGHSLAEAALRQKTGCHLIAVCSGGQMRINPDPSLPLEADEEIVLISTVEAEAKFLEMYRVS